MICRHDSHVCRRNVWPGDGRATSLDLFQNLSEKMFKIIFWRYDCHLVEDKAMSYSPQHKHDTREKILESARRLFNRNGYSGVSIDEIMTEAGLTHGASIGILTARMNSTRQPSGSSCARKRRRHGKVGALPSRSLTHNGSWTPISRVSTSTITTAAARCLGPQPMLNAMARS